MNKTVHAIFVWSMVAITVAVTVYLSYTGYDYYRTPLYERFYHEHHDWFKPSGAYGHGIGILGTLMILFGVSIYIARKRYNFMSKQLRLKYLLEFHIFLCTLGPILILFHTAFKFGGIVSVAFWSMVAVVASGVIGRFIYIQIPRTIEGRELSLNEVKDMRSGLINDLKHKAGLGEELIQLIIGESNEPQIEIRGVSFMARYADERNKIRLIKKALNEKQVAAEEKRSVIKMVKDEFALTHRIGRLELMQRLFKYWHVAHLPLSGLTPNDIDKMHRQMI
ncbi:MAG: hypothetical protein O2867_10030 [Bacteroidetes bacterium]|nr:hypothetical protein [Bacteroidota bacterium]